MYIGIRIGETNINRIIIIRWERQLTIFTLWVGHNQCKSCQEYQKRDENEEVCYVERETILLPFVMNERTHDRMIEQIHLVVVHLQIK